ncbi:hypothetical protein Q0Z83_112150 [Actinoplanes sichuanensis]|nr:hypothetical protein Q0Z83_112150 [Actinoplanes sichuanensis]
MRGRTYLRARFAGATDVVLFTDAANPANNALYQGIGYLPITEWAVYGFGCTEPPPA